MQPAEYHDATHLLVPKDSTEAAGLLQDEIQHHLFKAMSTFEQFKNIQSQSSQNTEPVVPQRNAISNQQSVGANSTASLGRASQQEPPVNGKWSTLDAQGSSLQQFVEGFEKVHIYAI